MKQMKRFHLIRAFVLGGMKFRFKLSATIWCDRPKTVVIRFIVLEFCFIHLTEIRWQIFTLIWFLWHELKEREKPWTTKTDYDIFGCIYTSLFFIINCSILIPLTDIHVVCCILWCQYFCFCFCRSRHKATIHPTKRR